MAVKCFRKIFVWIRIDSKYFENRSSYLQIFKTRSPILVKSVNSWSTHPKFLTAVAFTEESRVYWKNEERIDCSQSLHQTMLPKAE